MIMEQYLELCELLYQHAITLRPLDNAYKDKEIKALTGLIRDQKFEHIQKGKQ